MKFLILLSVLFSFQVSANEHAKKLRACRADEIAKLVSETNKDMNSLHMTNIKGEIVGIYSWAEGEVFAEVCDYLQVADVNMTYSNDWFYWNSDSSSNPSNWSKSDFYELHQDEGISKIEVLKASKKGEVSFKFTIVGWDGEGIEHDLHTELLSLKSIK